MLKIPTDRLLLIAGTLLTIAGITTLSLSGFWSAGPIPTTNQTSMQVGLILPLLGIMTIAAAILWRRSGLQPTKPREH